MVPMMDAAFISSLHRHREALVKVGPSIGLTHDSFQAATQLLQKHLSAGPESTLGPKAPKVSMATISNSFFKHFICLFVYQ